MSTSASESAGAPAPQALAVSVQVTDDALVVDLDDGRTISVPLA